MPGAEMLDARFFAPDRFPDAMHYGHDRRIPVCLDALASGQTYFDPSASYDAAMPMHQRPSEGSS